MEVPLSCRGQRRRESVILVIVATAALLEFFLDVILVAFVLVARPFAGFDDVVGDLVYARLDIRLRVRFSFGAGELPVDEFDVCEFAGN